jgi:hypothetical protein
LVAPREGYHPPRTRAYKLLATFFEGQAIIELAERDVGLDWTTAKKIVKGACVITTSIMFWRARLRVHTTSSGHEERQNRGFESMCFLETELSVT